MVETALTVLSGTLLYAGVHHLYLGSTHTSPQPHGQLAAMYLLLAGFVLTSAYMVQSQEFSAQVNIARLSMTTGILLWVALIWYVAFHTRSKPLLLLDFLTAAWAILLIRNLSSPYGLLYADVASIASNASVSSWWTAISFTMLASLLFCFYASIRLFIGGNRQAALALACGLSVLLASSLTDHLLNTRFGQTLYLAPFGFIGFLLINSVYAILLDYRKSRKTIQTPVIYSLTFNPEQTSFHGTLADLRLPRGEEPKVTPAAPPESPANTLSPDNKVNCAAREGPLGGKVNCAARQGESPPGERRSPGGQGESPPGERGSPGGEAPLAQVAMDVAVPELEPPPRRQGIREETSIPERDQPALNTVSDNLIDIAVYATMALNRFKRGDVDPQAQEMLCRKIRSKAIKTRRLANRLSRPGKPDSDVL